MTTKRISTILLCFGIATTFATGHVVTITPTHILCNSDSTGSAIATVNGGIGPFTYTWSNASSGVNITGLKAGSYTCTVTDNNDLSKATASIIITQPAAIITNTTSEDATCKCDGKAIVEATGGYGLLKYMWSDGKTGSVDSLNCASSFTVTVTDSNGCTKTDGVLVNNWIPHPPVANITSPINCSGGKGAASVTISGDWEPPFKYVWSNGFSGSSTNLSPVSEITNITAGQYSVTITDANGCTISASTFLYEPPPINIVTSTTPETNSQKNGSASFAASGGTGILSFAWSDLSQTGYTITGLSCGTYSVTVTDDNGCTATSTAVVSCLTGIGEIINELGFSIYPNPTTTIITIEATTNKPYTIQLINLLGEIIYNTQQTAINKIIIDVGVLPKGIYLVKQTDMQNEIIGREKLLIQ